MEYCGAVAVKAVGAKCSVFAGQHRAAGISMGANLSMDHVQQTLAPGQR